MQTRNNIYAVAGEPIARYIRTPIHAITGWRHDHDDPNNRKVEFSLVGSPEGFDYERDVIEIYTDKEHKFFKQANKYLFQQGFLAYYEGEPEPIDVTNMLTDTEVFSLATERNVNRLKAELGKLTSRVSVQRIYDVAVEVGRPAKTLALIKEHLDSL